MQYAGSDLRVYVRIQPPPQADAVIDEVGPYHNLPVWGELHGARMKIISGGIPIDAGANPTCPQRTMKAAVKADINAYVC